MPVLTPTSLFPPTKHTTFKHQAVSGKKRVKKIITGNQNYSQIALAVFGCLVGFFLILVSVQSILNFKYLFSDSKQGIGSQYMVINKKVTLFGSLNIAKTSFSKKEINEIANHPSITKYSPFVANDFEALAYLELKQGDQQMALQTDLFLESVDDGFIDVEMDRWKWNENDPEIPIILPSDFINLYNFSYAPARGLPQLSKSTVGFFGFVIQMAGNNDRASFKANIIGFSDRITSMIVPMGFMAYANKRFGAGKPENQHSVYRIIAEVKPDKLSAFQQFLLENNYETNQELLRNGKFVTLMYLIISIVFIIGLIISLNAFTGFVLYFNLLIYRSKEEIDSLLRLGYGHNRLVANYMVEVSKIFLFIILLALGGLIWSQYLISNMLFKYSFQIPDTIHVYPVLTMLLTTGVLILVFFLQMRNEIFKIALPGPIPKEKKGH